MAPNGSNRAWRPGRETGAASRPAALLCLCCVGLCSLAVWVWDVLWPRRHETSWPRVYFLSFFLLFFLHSDSLIRFGAAEVEEQQHEQPSCPIASACSAAQHDAAQRKCMARQHRQVRRTTRGTGRRNRMTRQMAWRRVSKPASRYACIPSVPCMAQLTSLAFSLLQHHPIPRDTPHIPIHTKARRRHDTISD